MFYGEIGEINAKPFRIIRRENHHRQEAFEKEIARKTGRRKRWDIPIGEIIQNGHHAQIQKTNSEVLPLLRRIIRREQ